MWKYAIVFPILVGVFIFFSQMFINGKIYDSEINKEKYLKAKDDFLGGRATDAIAAYKELGKYKDSAERFKECSYSYARAKFDAGNFDESFKYFAEIKEYKDVKFYLDKIEENDEIKG